MAKKKTDLNPADELVDPVAALQDEALASGQGSGTEEGAMAEVDQDEDLDFDDSEIDPSILLSSQPGRTVDDGGFVPTDPKSLAAAKSAADAAAANSLPALLRTPATVSSPWGTQDGKEPIRIDSIADPTLLMTGQVPPMNLKMGVDPEKPWSVADVTPANLKADMNPYRSRPRVAPLREIVIRVPVCAEPFEKELHGYAGTRIDMDATGFFAQPLQRLLVGLNAAHATYPLNNRNQHVDTTADVVRWILCQVLAQLDEHEPVADPVPGTGA